MEERSVAKEKHRINRAITAQQVRLIDQNGEAVGVVNIREAMVKAREAGLDLVEVAPQAKPPKLSIMESLSTSCRRKNQKPKKSKRL